MTRFRSTFTRLAAIGLAAFALVVDAMESWRDHIAGWALGAVQAIPAPMAPPGIVREPQGTAHQRTWLTVANAYRSRIDKRSPAI